MTDLESSNGTLTSSIQIERAVVASGTGLRVGETSLRVASVPVHALPGSSPTTLYGMVCASDAMRRVVDRIEAVAEASISVLLEGETGVGKELVATAIHERSPRSSGPFVTVDCGSIPGPLLPSQLFGHERGAFTGAHRRHVGAFERADGGTLFLDEIAELPPSLQPALLGALERRRFLPVGAAEEVAVNIRVVAATHRDLRGAVNAGTFRADLYYRLAGVRIQIPPLRERPEDIGPLVHHFAREVTGISTLPFGDAQMEELRERPWNGNVRELRNAVHALCALGFLEVNEMGAQPPAALGGEASYVYREARGRAVSAFERSFLERLMRRTQGNVSEASRVAQMDRKYLTELLRRHGMR